MRIIEQNPYRQLGVFANSPTRERVANHNRLKAFLKVGRQVSFPLDLSQHLPAIERTAESVADAEAKLTLPKDQLKYGQFWFVKSTPIDNIAFNHLFAGNLDDAIGLWDRRDDASSLQNRTVCYLIKGEYESALICAQKLYADFIDQFVSLVLGDGSNVTTDELSHDFLDTICEEVGADNMLRYLESVPGTEWKEYVSKATIAPVIQKIQDAISTAKGRKGKGPAECLAAGKKLMSTTKPLLTQLRKLLPKTDLQYQLIADKLGLEILQCGIDYYNASDEPDCATKAMQLQEYALKVVVGKMAKDRCQENVDILKKIIAELPPAEVMDEHNAIHIALVTFATQPDLIIYSQQLIKTSASHLVSIKEKLGRDNKYYLKISTTVVNSALGNIIAEVNEAQTGGDFEVLKSTLVGAWRTQLYLDKFDVEPAFRDGRFKECRSALHGIIEQCKGFESKTHSFMYRYGCGWCNNLDVSDVDLRTDDEYFFSCRDLASYRGYLQKFPKGKHVSEAKSKIEELRYTECKTTSDYQKFITDYPNSVYRTKAQASLDKLRHEEEERRKKKARQEAEIAACGSLDDVLTLYARQKGEGIDVNKCSDKAFELAKTKSDFEKILSTFHESSTGGKRAKEKIDAVEKARKKTVRWACWIGIPILVLLIIFIIWGVSGLAVTCAIIAGISGLTALTCWSVDDFGCVIFFISAGIAVIFGLSASRLFSLAESIEERKESEALYNQIIVTPTEDACSDYIRHYAGFKHTNDVRDIWLNLIVNESNEFDYTSTETNSSSNSYSAQTKNPLQKLEDFVEKNKGTDYEERAESYLETVCDSLYNIAKLNATVVGWKQYQRVVPSSYYRDSEEKIEEIESQAWNTEPKAWQQATAENSLSAYNKYKSLYPKGAHINQCEKEIIDLEVSSIYAGEHGTLPAMERTGYGGGPTSYITITNSTSYTLTILYSGPDSKKLVIEASGTKSIRLKNGQYKVAASVDAYNVRRFAGTEDLRGGNYSADYYISTIAGPYKRTIPGL